MRASAIYTDRASPSATQPGYNSDTPTAGHYRMALVRGGHPVGICIWHGPPHDPVTGELLDRSHRWQATANGAPIDLERVWPRCAHEPIGQAEHDHLVRLQRWGERHAPDGPQANPTRRIDLLDAATPMPF